MRAHQLRSLLIVPLAVEQTLTGYLCFCGLQPRAFSACEIGFGRQLGVTVALAAEHARRHPPE